jgi:uncharacterized protein
MKRILSIAVIILAFLLCLCGCGNEETFPKPTERFYVGDFADIISDSEEANMVEKAAALAEATTAQVVVVTVESLNGYEISDYALEIGREWGVGDKEADNGIVILLSTGEREVYVAVGYGLEGALPDSKTGRIIDVYGIDYFKQDNFSQGLIAVADAVINEVYIEYGMAPESGYVSIDNVTTEESLSESGGSVIISWFILLIIIFVLSFFGRGRIPFIWFGGPGSFGGGYRSGGFGSGGGSSFGGFRGGGGSFGGGGAGRGF